MSFELGNVVKYEGKIAQVIKVNRHSVRIEIIENENSEPFFTVNGKKVKKITVRTRQFKFIEKLDDSYREPFTVSSTQETIESKEDDTRPTTPSPKKKKDKYSPLKQSELNMIKQQVARVIVERINEEIPTADNQVKLMAVKAMFQQLSREYDFLQLPQIIKLVTDLMPELRKVAAESIEESGVDFTEAESMSMAVEKDKKTKQDRPTMMQSATPPPTPASKSGSSDMAYSDEDPKQVGKYLRPDGTPCLYQSLFQSIFGGYSIDAFREHIKDKHGELVRQLKPDPKQKATFYRNSVTGFLKSTGPRFLGMYRAVPQTKMGTQDYINEIFQENEDLFELMNFLVIKPHLSKKMVQTDILKQDVAATSPGYGNGTAASGPSGGYRIGAIIDVEKLGINLGMLKSVLEGKPQQMMNLPSVQKDATGAARRLVDPEDVGKDTGTDTGSLEPSGDTGDTGDTGDNRPADTRAPVQPSRGDSQPATVTPSVMKAKKKKKTAFVPSRKRVLESARRLTIKRQPRTSLKRLSTPIHHAYQVNYYAPQVVEQVPNEGVYKSFE